MNIKRAIFILASVMLAACGSLPYDKHAGGRTQQDEMDRNFSFTSRVEISGRDTDDPAIEVMRIKDLERDLRSNGMCPKGYTITSRRTIIQIGEKDQVEYFGQCTG